MSRFRVRDVLVDDGFTFCFFMTTHDHPITPFVLCMTGSRPLVVFCVAISILFLEL